MDQDLIVCNRELADEHLRLSRAETTARVSIIQMQESQTAEKMQIRELLQIRDHLERSVDEYETFIIPAIQKQLNDKVSRVLQLEGNYQGLLEKELELESDLRKKQLESSELAQDIAKVIDQDCQKEVFEHR